MGHVRSGGTIRQEKYRLEGILGKRAHEVGLPMWGELTVVVEEEGLRSKALKYMESMDMLERQLSTKGRNIINQWVADFM